MKILAEIKNALLNANSKVLGTISLENDMNVVPVSSVCIVEDKIWLFDYFFNKTKKNVLRNPKTVLAFWSGLNGYQIKAMATYISEGEVFEEAIRWVGKQHPNRVLKGLLVLDPKAIFDISIANKQL